MIFDKSTPIQKIVIKEMREFPDNPSNENIQLAAKMNEIIDVVNKDHTCTCHRCPNESLPANPTHNE